MICVRNVYQRYVELWRRLTGWKRLLFYALHYTVLFALLWRWLYSDFYEANKSFIASGDEFPLVFVQGMVNVSQTVRDGIQSLLNGEGWTIPLYDFRSGASLQGPFLQALQFEWFLPSVFIPWDRQDIFHDCVVIFLYWLTGIAFSFLGFYYMQEPLPVMIGAISYTFCGFALWLGIHPNYMLYFSFLPLLIVGCEKVMRRENPFLLLVSVFLTMIQGLLFAYISAVFVFLFILIRFPALYRQNRLTEFPRTIGRLAIWAGTGVLLGSAVWVPTAIQLLENSRIGRNVSEYRSLLFHPLSVYQRIFAFFTVNSNDAFIYAVQGFSTLAIPAVILLFAGKRKQWYTLRIMFVLLTAMLYIPWVSYAMSGFNEILARWGYVYALCTAAVITFTLPHFADMDRGTFLKVCIGALTYFSVCYFVLGKGFYREEVFALLAVSILILGCFRLGGERAKKYVLPFCLALTCLSVYYSAHLLHDPAEQNRVAWNVDQGKAYSRLEAGQYFSLGQAEQVKADESFFHVGGSSISSAEVNASFYSGLNGLSFYNSNVAYSNAWMEWCKELELRWPTIKVECMGLLNRSSMLTLSNVKYYAARDNAGAALPYGFSETGRVDKDAILENNYFLPVGYTYSKYLSREEYEKLNALGKQEAQLQAVVLDRVPDSPQITHAAVACSAQKIDTTVTETKGLTWDHGVVNASENNASMMLEFEGLPNTETYLRIVNLDLTDGADERNWTVGVSADNTTAYSLFAADAYRLANGRKTQMYELGYTETGLRTCTITFPSTGTFKLEALEVWCQPMDRYGAQVNALRDETLENVETNWRGLTGTVSVSQDKILCFAIPYSEGWTAYVDGKRVELLQANTAFMAVELPAGDHEVELKYWTPGLTAGLVLSAVGAAGIAILAVYWKKRADVGAQGKK